MRGTMDETSEGLRSEIAHLRRLSSGVTDQRVKDEIAKMIEELERRLQDHLDQGTNDPR
jgi:hypothetical protein